MRRLYAALIGSLLATASAVADSSGVHDFDFLMGEWHVQHRVKRPTEPSGWLKFDGTCTERSLMNGAANVEEHIFNRPAGVSYGVALRAYDAKTDEWAIWWVDSRAPHSAMDPPMKGTFVNGVGTFYSDTTLDGKPMRVRFIWSHDTAKSAHWEQAVSFDAGKTWETNWVMEFERTG